MTAIGSAAGRERILVVGNPYLGDTMLALPFLRNLRAAFPDRGIDLLAGGNAVGSLLADCPHVDEVLRWERPPRVATAVGAWRQRLVGSLKSIEACAANLRRRGYERAYLLKRSPSAALLAFRAGIPRRVGHARGPASLLLTRSVRWRGDRHYADGLLDLLRADRVPVVDVSGRHWGASPTAAARVAALLAHLPAGRPRLFVAVRATDGRRQWPLDRWVDVLRRLVREHGCEVVFCGGPDDAPAIAVLTADLGAVADHAHDLSAAVPLADVAALLARVDMYLGVNSGLMHVAAACGTPTVAIFNAADVVRWRPRGVPHVVLCGAATRRGAVVDGFARAAGRPRDGIRATGMALREVSVDEAVAGAVALLPSRPAAPAPRLVDLRTGRHRYGVLERPALAPEGVPAGG